MNGADSEDMLAGNSGNDTILAYSPAEIYGGEGDDTIHAYGKDSFIVGGSGTDEIGVFGGGNTICFINTTEGPTDSQHLFGNDIVKGTTKTDVLKFSVDYGEGANPRFVGYKASDLSVSRSGADLVISAKKAEDEEANTVTIKEIKRR